MCDPLIDSEWELYALSLYTSLSPSIYSFNHYFWKFFPNGTWYSCPDAVTKSCHVIDAQYSACSKHYVHVVKFTFVQQSIYVQYNYSY